MKPRQETPESSKRPIEWSLTAIRPLCEEFKNSRCPQLLRDPLIGFRRANLKRDGGGLSDGGNSVYPPRSFSLSEKQNKEVGKNRKVAIALMSTIAGIAGYLPAHRAARVDPTVVLRHE
jgi:hypothetical protein